MIKLMSCRGYEGDQYVVIGGELQPLSIYPENTIKLLLDTMRENERLRDGLMALKIDADNFHSGNCPMCGFNPQKGNDHIEQCTTTSGDKPKLTIGDIAATVLNDAFEKLDKEEPDWRDK